ncbi:MAG: hypothetical protein HY806_02710 [Nitrospirae bacterium]|nr:hypothetical protein [Nitrospirota bacterium]
MPTTKKTIYHEPNDTYFKEHLSEFVKKHGGEWVVIAGGQLIGFARKDNISALMKKARELFPADIPMLSPIPREEELECIL